MTNVRPVRLDGAPNDAGIVMNLGQALTEDAYGAKGIGAIRLIPTAPAVAQAYLRRDGRERLQLPLEGTYYRR